MCLKSCLHSLKSRPIQVNVPQGCFHSLNCYSGLIILPTSGGYLKLINHIISDKRIQLLAGIPLCKSQELSQREQVFTLPPPLDAAGMAASVWRNCGTACVAKRADAETGNPGTRT